MQAKIARLDHDHDLVEWRGVTAAGVGRHLAAWRDEPSVNSPTRVGAGRIRLEGRRCTSPRNMHGFVVESRRWGRIRNLHCHVSRSTRGLH